MSSALGAVLLLQTLAVPDLLLCRGSAVGEVATGRSSAVVTDSFGNSAVGNSVDTEVREIDAVIQLKLNGSDPRVNIPRILAPDIASSKAGWYRVKDLEISDEYIKGKVVFNFISSSRFEIDRRTGVLTSTGGFQGMCEAAEINERKF